MGEWISVKERLPRQLDTILKVCRLETINSATKDDLRYLLRWLADKMIEEEVADG